MDEQTLYTEAELERIRGEERRWVREKVEPWIERTHTSERKTSNSSGISLKRLYTPADLRQCSYVDRLGFPGEPPFTRGVYPTMYRGRPWTMRMISAYGTSEETNKRLKFLIDHGETGINLTLDSPTIYGYDSDDHAVKGEVGQGGAPISSLADMEVIFDGIPIDKVTASLITHYLGLPVFSMFVAMAEGRGYDLTAISGTTQNDPMWFFHVANPVLPLRPSIKLAVDLLEWCAQNMPKWYAVNVCGYHPREAGATAVQEAAISLADATVYLDESIKRGLDIDQVAPLISFFMDVHNNFFEEIAKFRAMRRIWARMLRERYGAKKDRSLLFKFASQTAGCALTAQDPENNIVRVAIHALAAVLSGTQSLATDAYDEALGLPTEKSAKVALRTQQILLHETGVADVIDPLGGSYYLEWLTDEVEEQVLKYLDRVSAMGGVLAATEKGFFRREVTESSYRYQQNVESGQVPVVGVNVHQGKTGRYKPCIVTLKATRRQAARLRRLKRTRNQGAVEKALGRLKDAAGRGENLCPYVIDCARAYATNGEIYGVFREVYGREPPPVHF